jgi:hypothetical protein
MPDAPIRRCSVCGTGDGGAYRLARAQGYRDGHGQALADVQRALSVAIGLASEHPREGEYRLALQHARAIVGGLREKARRRDG